MPDASFFDPVYDRRNTGSVKYMDISAASGLPVIPMWVADMDFRSPPAVIDALSEMAQHGIYGYGEADEEYDALVTDWYLRRMGWCISKEHIIKAPGVMFGAAAAIRALTEPNDAMLIFQPVYYPFANIISANDRRAVVSELILRNGRYELDFEDVENRIRHEGVKALLFCSPHNPVARVWSKDELTALAEICRRNNVFIISDEIHSDFIYPGHTHIPMASLSDEIADMTVTCISPTKTFNLAGLQAANIVAANTPVRKRIEKECIATGYGGLSITAIAAAKAAYKDGEEWLDVLLEYLQRSIAMLKEAFPKDYPVTFLNMEGTYLAWLDCRRLELSCPRLQDLFLNRAGIWLYKGSIFGAGGDGFMRMNIACPHSVLCEALRRIKLAIDDQKGEHHGKQPIRTE